MPLHCEISDVIPQVQFIERIFNDQVGCCLSESILIGSLISPADFAISFNSDVENELKYV